MLPLFMHPALHALLASCLHSDYPLLLDPRAAHDRPQAFPPKKDQ
jgi:hypothetical protein